MASRIREYAKIDGLTIDWLGKRAVPSPKTMITFRSPQLGLSFTMDLDWRVSNRSDGIKPDPTDSNTINAPAMAIAVLLRRLNRAKAADATREKSMARVIIWTDVLQLRCGGENPRFRTLSRERSDRLKPGTSVSANAAVGGL